MTIRQGYTKDDIAPMLKINTLCFKGDELPPEEEFRSMLSISDVWVAKDEEGVIGFAVVKPGVTSAYLWSIAVHPDFQDRYVGQNLMREVELHYRREKMKDLTLHVHYKNRAQRFYLSIGFTVFAVAADYYGVGERGIRMIKEL